MSMPLPAQKMELKKRLIVRDKRITQIAPHKYGNLALFSEEF